MSALVLDSRPGCHLCDDARAVIERVGAPFEEIDIETDDALHAAYLVDPVVALDGVELFEYFVEEGALREHLDRVDRSMPSGDSALTKPPRPPDSAAPDGVLVGGERLSLGVAARLSRYLQVLSQAKKMGKETISSRELSEYTHVNSTQIRRDFSGFGLG